MSKLFILSAPSGTGKTTIANKVLESLDSIERVVTATTRKPRPGEINGRDYIFLSKEEFEAKISGDEFLEYAQVYGNYYGTPKGQVEENLQKGIDSLLVIDVQGAFQVKSKVPDAVSVFLLPPSFEELERRIANRGFVDENLKERMKLARREVSCAKEFDYVIINDFIDKAVNYLKAVILASRCKVDNFLEGTKHRALDSEVLSLIRGGDCYVKKT